MFEDQKFEKADYRFKPLAKGDYDACIFSNCDFSDSDLSGISFTDCEFISCNLSMVRLNKTALKDVKFRDCKCLGLHFENCNDFLFSVSFENCILNLSCFYRLDLKKTIFKNSSLQETDFSDCDLSSSLFDNCDLNGAVFSNTNLEKADFRSSVHFSIDPEKNKLKKAKFSLAGLPGLLDKYKIEVY